MEPRAETESTMVSSKSLGTYIHIPYCRTLCPYCDFVRTPVDGAVPETYAAALLHEIGRFHWPGKAGSLFLGGGTPSLLTPAQLEHIFNTLRPNLEPHAEVTLEANPDDVTKDLAQTWRDVGVNRVSLGVQSFDDDVLRYLGRRHNAAKAHVACEIVARVFENWSMDLIFGAHPVEPWAESLRQCVDLAPPHVSAYALTYEPGTPFGGRQQEGIDDDLSLRMYLQAEELLSGYDHYEISNWARPGSQCRHNLVYWRNESYAGFGAGAYSFIDRKQTSNLTRHCEERVPACPAIAAQQRRRKRRGNLVLPSRARNHTGVRRYLECPGDKTESLVLSDAEVRVETLIQHFRLRAGLPKDHYRSRFGSTVRDDFAKPLDALFARGLLEETSDAIRPTRQGFYLNNEIGLELVG